MPYLMDTGARVNEIVDAVVYLVERDGVGGLSIRRIADVLRCSPSTLTSHLENRQRIIRLVALRVGDRVVDHVDRRARRRGIDAVVPDEEHLRVVRAWLALVELVQSDEVASGAVADVVANLRLSIGWAFELDGADEAVLDALLAATIGTWRAMCAGTDPISADRARAALRHAFVALGAPPAAVA